MVVVGIVVLIALFMVLGGNNAAPAQATPIPGLGAPTEVATASGPTPVPTAQPTPVRGDWVLPTPVPAQPGQPPVSACPEGQTRRETCMGTTRVYQVCRGGAWPTIQEPNSQACGGTAPVATAVPVATEAPTAVATPAPSAVASPAGNSTPTA